MGLATGAISALSQASLAAPYCNQSDGFFQDPTPPVERVNGVNVQRCSSGMACINQVYAAVIRQQPKPAAYRWRKEEKRVCLEPIPIPGTTNNGEANPSADAANPGEQPAATQPSEQATP